MIPQPVRTALHLRAGDEISSAIEGDRIVPTRVRPEAVADDPSGCFSEWHSAADTEAYAGL